MGYSLNYIFKIPLNHNLCVIWTLYKNAINITVDITFNVYNFVLGGIYTAVALLGHVITIFSFFVVNACYTVSA